MKDFETAFVDWLARAQKISDDYMAEHFPTLAKSKLTFERGQKYIRIIREDGRDSRSVHCFVDIVTGDVLKSESWKKPAKGARGTIYDPENPGVNHYGGLYKR